MGIFKPLFDLNRDSITTSWSSLLFSCTLYKHTVVNNSVYFVVIDLIFILFSICFLKKIVFEFVQAGSIDRHYVPLWQPASVMLTIVLVVIVVIMWGK